MNDKTLICSGQKKYLYPILEYKCALTKSSKMKIKDYKLFLYDDLW